MSLKLKAPHLFALPIHGEGGPSLAMVGGALLATVIGPFRHFGFAELRFAKAQNATFPINGDGQRKSIRRHVIASLSVFGLLIATTATAQVAPGQQGILNALTQRQFMLSADTRCNLLEGPRREALGAGFLQARNEAVRQGLGGALIYDTLNAASNRANGVNCQDAALRTEADQVSNAFKSFVQQLRYELKGQRGAWTIDRSYGDDETWRLVQTLNAEDQRFAFGLYGTLNDKSLTVMAQLPPNAAPFAARLIVRRAGLPPIRRLDPNAPNVSQTVPIGFDEGSADTFMARAHSADKRVLVKVPKTLSAGINFSPETQARETERFDFPSAALRAMGPLDPRDDVVVAFDYGDYSVYVRFEVGDFIPGMILSGLPSPYTHNKAHKAPY